MAGSQFGSGSHEGRRFQKHDHRQLVEQFVSMALQQDDANLTDNIARYNRLFDRMTSLKQELTNREGDRRRALLHLCDHENAQVRFQAAIAIAELAPEKARQTFQIISDRNEYPEAGDARRWIRRLDEGRSKSK